MKNNNNTIKISSADARLELAEMLAQVEYAGSRYVITKHGKDAAIMISMKEWDAIIQIAELSEISEQLDI